MVVSSGGIETVVRIIDTNLNDRDMCEDALKLFLVIKTDHCKTCTKMMEQIKL